MSKRKFYRVVLQAEVLCEEDDLPAVRDGDLVDFAYLISDGPCSGSLKEISCKKLNGRNAAAALLEQGSDPGFFRLTETGDDEDEDDQN